MITTNNKRKHMKKYFLLVLVVQMILLVGCNAPKTATNYDTLNSLEDVKIVTKEGTVSATGLTIVFENDSEETYTYGEFYLLEKKDGDDWVEVPVTIEENYGFNDIGYEIAPLTITEQMVDWEWLYGSLAPGEYRMLKEVLGEKESGNYEEYSLTVEFVVSDEDEE